MANDSAEQYWCFMVFLLSRSEGWYIMPCRLTDNYSLRFCTQGNIQQSQTFIKNRRRNVLVLPYCAGVLAIAHSRGENKSVKQ